MRFSVCPAHIGLLLPKEGATGGDEAAITAIALKLSPQPNDIVTVYVPGAIVLAEAVAAPVTPADGLHE